MDKIQEQVPYFDWVNKIVLAILEIEDNPNFIEAAESNILLSEYYQHVEKKDLVLESIFKNLKLIKSEIEKGNFFQNYNIETILMISFSNLSVLRKTGYFEKFILSFNKLFANHVNELINYHRSSDKMSLEVISFGYGFGGILTYMSYFPSFFENNITDVSKLIVDAINRNIATEKQSDTFLNFQDGLSGALFALTRVSSMEGIENYAKETVERIVDILISFVYYEEGALRFPIKVNMTSNNFTTYDFEDIHSGSIVILVVLYNIGLVKKNDKLVMWSYQELKKKTLINNKDLVMKDFSLKNGSAGILALFHYMQKESRQSYCFTKVKRQLFESTISGLDNQLIHNCYDESISLKNKMLDKQINLSFFNGLKGSLYILLKSLL